MTGGTGGDIDPADSEQLFLPGFLSVVFFDSRFLVSEDLPTKGDLVFVVSIGQEAEVTDSDIACR